MLLTGFSEISDSPKIEYAPAGGYKGTRTFVGPVCNLQDLFKSTFGWWFQTTGDTWSFVPGADMPPIWAARCDLQRAVNYKNQMLRNMPVAYRLSSDCPHAYPIKFLNDLPLWTTFKTLGTDPPTWGPKAGACRVDQAVTVEIEYEGISTHNINAENPGEEECSPSSDALIESAPAASNIPLQVGTFMEIHYEPTVEAVSQPGRYWKVKQEANATAFTGGVITGTQSRPEDAVQHAIMPVIQISCNWKAVPNADWKLLNESIGKVNLWPFLGFPREGVVFGGYNVQSYHWWQGILLHNISLLFLAKTVEAHYGEATLFETSPPAGDCPGVKSKYLIFRGRAGRFNRGWSNYPIQYPAPGGTFHQHWRRLVYHDAGEELPFKEMDFGKLFIIPEITSSYRLDGLNVTKTPATGGIYTA